MKYNININQLVLSKTDLDLKDSAILDYIIVICNSKSKAVRSKRKRDEQGGEWTWINFKKLIKDMPLLRIKSKGAITPRINNIEKEGFIKTIQTDDKKLFIQLTEKIDILYMDTVQNDEQGVHENEQGVHENEQVLFNSMNIHNNTIYNNTTKNTIEEETCVSTPKQLAQSFFNLEDNQDNRDIILPLREKYGKEVDIEIKKFISYWTEPTPSGKKQRWEIEKTFEVKRRLITWLNNSNKYKGFEKKEKEIIGMEQYNF